jgi:protein phosphatase
MVEESEILKILNGSLELPEKAEKLVGIANENGGADNITVIIIEPNLDEVAEC